jgi:hypothetical protein
LMMTRAATTTTTSPTASHVKSPAGRPVDFVFGRGKFAPGFLVPDAADTFLLGGFLATTLLVLFRPQT